MRRDPQNLYAPERGENQQDFERTAETVADLDHAMEWAAIGAAHRLRTRARIARLRMFLAEIERAADAGIGIDWADSITLPRLEEAMEAELALRARLAGWVRERGTRR
jgi:hypothetical protein